MINKLFDKLAVEQLNENFFRIINNEWMLITAGSMDNFNTMTASWGTVGILWHKPITICFIRPQRHTFSFAEKSEIYTLSFFENSFKQVLNYCGTHSGKNVDKISQTGLKPLKTPNGGISFEQSRLIIESKKLYSDYIKEENFILKNIINQNYPDKDFHKFYIGEIMGCYGKK